MYPWASIVGRRGVGTVIAGGARVVGRGCIGTVVSSGACVVATRGIRAVVTAGANIVTTRAFRTVMSCRTWKSIGPIVADFLTTIRPIPTLTNRKT